MGSLWNAYVTWQEHTASIHNSFQTYIEQPFLNASFLSLSFVFAFCFLLLLLLLFCLLVWLFVCLCVLICFKVSLLSTGNVPFTDDLFKTKLFAFEVSILVCLTRHWGNQNISRVSRAVIPKKMMGLVYISQKIATTTVLSKMMKDLSDSKTL